ncbi:MAG: tail fiber protein [Solirubrobacteraceae bacterium]|nr:tail fiber protein [Patulibacter sp.]
MADPYIGEIRIFAGNFAPAGWSFCEGQLLPISENDTLYNLIGTTYGGDGQETFALPDLRGRLPLHQGNGYTLGQAAGVETVTLNQTQIPAHTHSVIASGAAGTTNAPTGALLAASPSISLYKSTAGSTPMAADIVTPTGGSQPHENLQPYLCLNFIISLFGIYPTQS